GAAVRDLRRSVSRPVSAVRNESERSLVRLCRRGRGPAVGRAAAPEVRMRRTYGGTEAESFEATEAEAPRRDEGRDAGGEPVSEVRGSEDAASGVSDVRHVRGQAGHRGRGDLGAFRCA